MTDQPDAPNGLLERIGMFAESRRTQNVITTLIVLNALTLGVETDPDVVARFGDILHGFDNIVLVVFCAEILAKLGYRRAAFFKDGWNLFDFFIVGIALLPSTGPLAVLRTLRIFRVLRLLSVIPTMRRVTQALLTAIPGILSVGSMILLIFYVSSVLTTNFFGAAFGDWFGNVGRSMFTLFQIMTLESWSMGIVRPVMVQFPFAWIFFVIFILITSFAVLNLFIGIIVDAMQRIDQVEAAALHHETEEILDESLGMHEEIRALRADIERLSQMIEAREPIRSEKGSD
jgi:voltage-gated sodium channel